MVGYTIKKNKMKISFSSVVVILLIVSGAISCNKYDFNYPPDMVGESTVVYYPIIVTNATNDTRVQYINKGDSYVDSGATATLNNIPSPYTTDGKVDPSTPGVYVLTYTAANPQGFTATDFRTVVVMDNDIAANDFSGTYTRSSNGSTSTWTLLSPGIYSLENPSGNVGYDGDFVILVNYSGTKFAIPYQKSDVYGLPSSANAAWSVVGSAYSYIFVSFGSNTRSFSK
jgi:Domain of unknown function (DUF5011)